MTEEQIKQNAEEYAKRNEQTLVNKDSDGYLMTDHPALVECYIAGAHSRDEEIEKLKKELLSARKAFAKLSIWCDKK